MLRLLALALALTPLIGLAPAAPAVEAVPHPNAAAADESGVGIRLLDVPANSQDDPRARAYIVDHIAPGSTIERRVQIVNHSTSPQSVRVYSGAAQLVDDTFTPADQGGENELSRWTSFDHDVVEMAPGASANVVVTVAVPSDAAEGEQYAAVWAEVRSATTPEADLVSASRVGIRMYVSVGPGNGPAASFTIGQLVASIGDDGARVLTAVISNTGGRALDLGGTLALASGPGDLSAGPFDSGAALTLAPGDSGEMTVTLDKAIPAGPWRATLQVRSGLLEHELTSEITFSEHAPVREDAGNWVPLAVAGGLVAVTLLAGLLQWNRWRRRMTLSKDVPAP